MQDESSRSKEVDGESVQQAVLSTLLIPDQQRPWAVAEIQRAIGDENAAADALSELHAEGLIHRCGEFVFASRAAVRADEISA
jgi:hypothetical protein